MNLSNLETKLRNNGRKGQWHGRIFTFTHRNPVNGEVWSDDIGLNGCWVKPDEVEWL